MKIGALYIRVSTDDQLEYSPAAQQKLGLDYAKKNGIVIPKDFIFVDEGISGRKVKNRPAFQQLISLAKSNEHPIEVILVWKFSRFARNQEESIVYKNLLKRAGVELVSISEPLPDGAIGQLVERIFEWMDEYYSINLGVEVLRGMSERARQGGCNVSPPLGYKMEDGSPVIVPEQAIIVKKIFDFFVNDKLSFYDIAVKLNSLGYKTKRGGNFQNRTVAYILRNEFYDQQLVWNKTEKATRKLKDSSEWISVKGDYPRIISHELWEAAQERDKATRRPRGSRPASTYRHWLSGMLVCSNCGGKLVRVGTNKSGNTYFQCTNYNHASCSESHSTNARIIQSAILESFKDVISSGNVIYNATATKKDDSERALIEDNIKKISFKEARIKQAYRDGIDTIEEYKENKRILSEEKANLEQMLSELKDDNAEQTLLLKKIRSAYDIIASDETSETQKHEALTSVVQKIVFNKKEEKFTLYYFINY